MPLADVPAVVLPPVFVVDDELLLLSLLLLLMAALLDGAAVELDPVGTVDGGAVD